MAAVLTSPTSQELAVPATPGLMATYILAVAVAALRGSAVQTTPVTLDRAAAMAVTGPASVALTTPSAQRKEQTKGEHLPTLARVFRATMRVVMVAVAEAPQVARAHRAISPLVVRDIKESSQLQSHRHPSQLLSILCLPQCKLE